MSNNPIGLSCQEKINREDAIQSPYSTGEGNSCVTTKIKRSSIDGFDPNTDSIRAFMKPSSKKFSDSYVDKSVMEYRMSRTIVCDREIHVNDVKDICIDEGVSSLDNLFFRGTDEKSICKILPLEEDQNGGSIKDQENSSEVSKSIADDKKNSKISLEDHFAMDWTTHNDFKDLKQIEKAKLNPSELKDSTKNLIRKSYSSESLDRIGVQVCILLTKLLIMFLLYVLCVQFLTHTGWIKFVLNYNYCSKKWNSSVYFQDYDERYMLNHHWTQKFKLMS